MQEASRATLPLKLTAAGATDIGLGRTHNEDAVLIRTDLHLYLLADGAGGHNAGNVASALATTSIANFLEETAPRNRERHEVDRFGLPVDGRRLVLAIQGANRDILEIANTSNKRRGMGTTIVAVLVAPEHGSLQIAHVGDSRCYRMRDGHLEMLTFDHSLINDVLELRPDIDDDSLSRLPRHVVTRALGMENPVRVSIRSHQLAPGDRFLLCSDGLTDALEPEELAEVLRLPKNPEDLVSLLIDLAKNAGAQDNIAALVVSCEMDPSGLGQSRKLSAFPRARKSAEIEETGGAIDGPEIVFVGNEGEPEIEYDSPIHVVPAESSNSELIDALEDFVGPSHKGGRGARS